MATFFFIFFSFASCHVEVCLVFFCFCLQCPLSPWGISSTRFMVGIHRGLHAELGISGCRRGGDTRWFLKCWPSYVTVWWEDGYSTRFSAAVSKLICITSAPRYLWAAARDIYQRPMAIADKEMNIWSGQWSVISICFSFVFCSGFFPVEGWVGLERNRENIWAEKCLQLDRLEPGEGGVEFIHLGEVIFFLLLLSKKGGIELCKLLCPAMTENSQLLCVSV